MSLHIETAQNVGVDYEVASIGDRIIAQILDYLVYFCWAMTVIGIMTLLEKGTSSDSYVWIAIILMLPILFYPVLCEYFLDGQTVGKMATKIRVIRLDGNKATLSSYLLRWLLAIVDLHIFSGVVAVLTIAINGKGQRIGDIAAGTTVIKTKPTIKLEHILDEGLSVDYQPTFTEVQNLSDQDIRIVKKVVASRNEELMETTMHRIEELLKVNSLDTPYNFLQTIVNDHNYYAQLTDEV